MALRTMTASEGKVFAYKDEKGEEIILGQTLYLGINDDGSRYYEVDEPKYKEDKPEEEIVIEE